MLRILKPADALPVTREDAERVGAEQGLNAAAVAEALRKMRAHELVNDGPAGFVKHAESKSWF